MRAKHIYNKNAREKALLEEAYSQVNEGHAGPEVQVGSHVMWDRQRRFGIVDKVDDPENPTVAVVLDDDGAESIVDVKHLEEISGPIEDQEDPDHDRHLEPSHGHGAAYVEDDPLEPSWDAEWEDALADILADLANTWQEGEWGDADKESLKEYINKFIDQKLGDGKIDDDASRPGPNPGVPGIPGGGRPRPGPNPIHGGRPIRVRGQTMVPKLGRAAALRKEPGTDKDKLFYK